MVIETGDDVARYFAERPWYYTDGRGHFVRSPSMRQMRGLKPVGRFRNAKEASVYWEWLKALERGFEMPCPDIF